jgi:D-amino-acid oxidase
MGGAGLLAAACATLPSASPASRGCLPPVIVDPRRIIRHAVGLRPYRAAGFVVRSEALGDSRLVHNYGHGGAGITLSWGSSKLATSLGLPGHSGAVAVLGAGVMGLTTARLAQEAGFPVTIYAAALPPDTTSNIAGGQWAPASYYREGSVTPEWRVQLAAALEYSWRRFQIMVGDDYGIRWLPTYFEGQINPSDVASRYQTAAEELGRDRHPFNLDHVFRYTTMYVETGRFLRQMLRDVQGAGARIEVRSFGSPAELAALPEKLVFNCTGLGSRALFGDQDLHPMRGQLVILLPQPEVQYAFTGEAGYMFPRPDGIVLGGTFQKDNWSTDPDPATAQQILAAHQKLFGNLRCTD